MELTAQLLVILIFSVFFSGMETAFAFSGKLRFETTRKNNAINRILSYFYRHANSFMSAMFIGSNISLIAYGIVVAKLLRQNSEANTPINQIIFIVVGIIIATFAILVTKEFIPKTLFKIYSGSLLKILSIPALLCYIVLYPVSRFISFLSKAILRIFGINSDKNNTAKAFTKVDLDSFIQNSIDESQNKEEIETEIRMFQNVLDFSNIKVRDCMIPRTEIIAVEDNATLDELKEKFIENGISKVIVYKENIDNVIGYIHSSEMFKPLSDWRKNIRTIPIVPETMGAHKLMQLFMQQKRSLAIVVDEFGGTSGIVALEDLVEEILGDIEDEHDTNSTIARIIGNNEYILSGRMEIEKANKEFNLDLPEDDEYQTIGGLILHEFQSIPKINEIINVGKFQFKIIKATTTKIELVKLKVNK